MKILITGGAGFIGSNIADGMLSEGYEVVIADNLSTGKRAHIPQGVKFYEIDIRDQALDDVFQAEKPDIVAHQAAQLDVRVSIENPLMDADVNIKGSLNIIDLCVRHQVKKILFASTGGAIYGDDCIPADESMMPRPISGYGVAKLSVEQYLYCFYKIHALEYVALRYANVYGPRQNAHGEAGVVAIFTDRLLNNEPVTINGSGDQTRDFVFVNDVVAANIKGAKGDTIGSFNIGTGVETSINEIYHKLAHIAGTDMNPTYAPAKLGEQARSVLDCSKAMDELEWKPETILEDGLKDTFDYFRKITG